MDTEKIIKRRQLVVDPKFQYGLIIKFKFLVTIILISSLVLLTFIYNDFISTVLNISLGAGEVTSFEVAHLVNLSDLIWPVMLVILLSVTISSITVYILGVRFTHRMAGPVYRLRSNIAEMADGDLGKKVSIREKDYFQSLAAEIDSLREQWHKSVTELKTINRQLNDISNEEQKELLGRSDKIFSDLLKTVS
ncbi:MAG: methyl-accepting chemotaxis protein [Cyclobacteriaceae bacterium]|nr:methyl-accepting chemotaxis protein [Cyclobacteriaceae bacterium]